MYPTMAEIYHKFESKGLKLLTGSEGLSNAVASCGILDYEYEEKMIDKYLHIHFQKNQLVLTSFLYAKDNEFLISKAIRDLKQKGCSGLIIRNVFHISIRENIIRYAESMKFPIFLLSHSTLYFEDIIIAVHELNQRYASLYYCENKINYLFAHPTDTEAQCKTITEINPSFSSDIFSVYFKCRKELLIDEYIQLEKHFSEGDMLKNSDSMFYYKNGFMIICTRHMIQINALPSLISSYLQILSNDCTKFYIGTSSVYHSIADLQNSVRESFYSSLFHAEIKKEYIKYQDLGVYQVIIPHANDDVMKTFLNQYLYPLQHYDAENQTNLFQTALTYVQHHGNIGETAQVFNQHKNTIRYRLNKISQLLDCTITSAENYEKLMLAVKIYTCQNILNS